MSMYSWGANSHGQLGLCYESELCMTPQKVPFAIPAGANTLNAAAVQSIVGGGGHVLCIDTAGFLYSCGWNHRGQLGLGGTTYRNTLQLVSPEYFHGASIATTACGWDSSAAITNGGQLYVWGSNAFEQLGFCKRGFASIERPMRLTLPRDEEPAKVSLGLRHMCVLTTDNVVYVFGRLRLNDPRPEYTATSITHNKAQMTRIVPKMTAKMIASGQNHLLLCDGFQILAFGENKYGQSNSFESDDRIVQMAAGWTHNGILTAHNEVLLWGRNSYGQVGCSTQHTVPVPRKLELPNEECPKNLHLGSEHGLILTSRGNVVTWGWNEHGNCGNGSVENTFNPSVVALPSRCYLAGTGAGFCYASCSDP